MTFNYVISLSMKVEENRGKIIRSVNKKDINNPVNCTIDTTATLNQE